MKTPDEVLSLSGGVLHLMVELKDEFIRRTAK